MQISGPYTWLKLTGSLKKTGRAPLPNDIGTLSVIDNKTSAVISCWPWLFTIRNLSTFKMIFTITQLNFITNKSRNKNTSYILSYLGIFYSSLIILFPIKQSGVMPPWLQSIFIHYYETDEEPDQWTGFHVKTTQKFVGKINCVSK